jgi:hypothetical protein
MTYLFTSVVGVLLGFRLVESTDNHFVLRTPRWFRGDMRNSVLAGLRAKHPDLAITVPASRRLRVERRP